MQSRSQFNPMQRVKTNTKVIVILSLTTIVLAAVRSLSAEMNCRMVT